MESRLFILQMVIRQLGNDERIFYIPNIRYMDFLTIHKGLSTFPRIKTFIPTNFINDPQ